MHTTRQSQPREQRLANRDDGELVAALQCGDAEAFQALYQRYAGTLFNFLWHRTPDRETAEDLVQDTFAKIWQIRRELDPDRHFKALLYRIGRNLAIDHLRRLERQGPSSPLDEEQPTPETDPEAFFKRDRIAAALASLSPHQRRVFCLSRFEGLKYPQIAEVLAISVKTVEVHMGRALKKLRAHLHDLNQLIFFAALL